MIVICLEGCHGAGKTELCRRFEEVGVEILDEGFLDMPEYALHPQSLLMETTWVCSWFERLLRKSAHIRQGRGAAFEREAIFVADRSPFSAVFYSKNRGDLLEPVIREHIKELAEAAGILILTVHIAVPKELLWERILARLRREPYRAKYNEDKREWMETALRFYDSFEWDVSVSNDTSIEILMERCMNACAKKYERVRAATPMLDRASTTSPGAPSPVSFAASAAGSGGAAASSSSSSSSSSSTASTSSDDMSSDTPVFTAAEAAAFSLPATSGSSLSAAASSTSSSTASSGTASPTLHLVSDAGREHVRLHDGEGYVERLVLLSKSSSSSGLASATSGRHTPSLGSPMSLASSSHVGLETPEGSFDAATAVRSAVQPRRLDLSFGDAERDAVALGVSLDGEL